MRILIVDNDLTSRDHLISTLQELNVSVKVVGVLESVKQVEGWLQEHEEPDLIVIDIYLSDGLAFSLFEKIAINIPVIFTSSSDRYALQAFSVDCLDYLLKPVKREKLQRALNKFDRWCRPNDWAHKEYSAQFDATEFAPKSFRKALLVQVRDKLLPVHVADIACIYSTNRNTDIYLNDGKVMPYIKSLDVIIEMLDPEQFIRANKQYIVSKSAIKELVVWFDNRLLVHVPLDLPEPMYVSKNKSAEFKNWLMG